jgi:two-component system, OmpR family, KDP operon response regulator KdpE
VTTSARPVLVVDDEALILRALTASLGAAGYHVATAVDGRSALEAAALRHPAAVVLDLRLPDMDGVEVCRRLREWTDVPIIVVSALDGEADKIAALDAGADDYVTKPYSAGELLARLRASLRRVSESVDGAGIVRFGGIVVDLARQQVLRDGVLVHLTPTEYELVATLSRHPGKVLTHAMLLRAVWGLAYQGETHYVRVYMARLRRKLEQDPSRPRHLVTQSGIGYRLVTDELLAPDGDP